MASCQENLELIRKFIYGQTAHKRLGKCARCETPFLPCQEIVSKIGSNRSRRYCVGCARKMGIA